MARFGVTHDDEQRLEAEEIRDGAEHGFLRPLGAKLVTRDIKKNLLTIYPVNTLEGHHQYGKPKYDQIEHLEVEFESIPDDVLARSRGAPGRVRQGSCVWSRVAQGRKLLRRTY